jgi:NADPH:quinone reductase-like Zn-dependent oxidoreductase
MRAGHLEKTRHRELPSILGWDVSGVIVKVGESVSSFKVNDEVYARPDVTREGTYAEFVAVKADEIALKPKSITHIQAATIPLAGLTAWQALFDHGKLEGGQKILIHGAAGGVGTLAVQLAKWKGAYVIGTASERNHDFLKELGVDEVIDYNKEKFEEKLKDLDVVLDTIGGDVQKKSIGVLKHGGILVSTLGIVDEEAIKAAGVKGERFMALSIPEQLQQMAALIDEGKLKPVISEVFPLKALAEAHRKSEEGHTRGKIAIQVVGV